MLSLILTSANVRFQDPAPYSVPPASPVFLPHSLSLQILLPLPVYTMEMHAFYEGYVRTSALHPVSPAAYCSRIGLTFRLPGESSHNLYLTGVLLLSLPRNCQSHLPYPRSDNTISCPFSDPHLQSSDPFLPARLPVTSPGSHRPTENRPVFLRSEPEVVLFGRHPRSVLSAPSVRLPTP